MSSGFLDTEEQAAFRTMCQEFSKKEVLPRAAVSDEEESYSYEIFDKLADQGFMGILTPEELGGQGATPMELAIASEEVGYYDASAAMMIVGQACVTNRILLNFGTEEQKRKYLPPLSQGVANGKRQIGAFALTEPGAGSDASGIKTKAVLDGDHYVINGAKRFISNGAIATVIFLFAVTENGPSTFIVENTFPGFIAGKVEKKMGIRGSLTSELYFEDCIVPKENLVGQEGQGLRIALSILDEDRTALSLCACAMAQRCIDESVRYSKERIQFGKRISQFQNTQFQLAQMQTRTDAGRLLAYRAIDAIMHNDPSTSKYVAMAKLYCGSLVNDVARKAVQIHGGYGYTREYPVEKIMRDAKIFEIMTGTNEIMEGIIAKAMGVK